MKSVLLQIYDYKQMFDSIDLKEAVSDIFNVGVDDDSLTLIYKANSEIQMAVKTEGRKYCLTRGHIWVHPGLCAGGLHWEGRGGGHAWLQVQGKPFSQSLGTSG